MFPFSKVTQNKKNEALILTTLLRPKSWKKENKTKKEWNKQVFSLGSSSCVFGFLYFPDKVGHVTVSLDVRSKLTKMRDFFLFTPRVSLCYPQNFQYPLTKDLDIQNN